MQLAAPSASIWSCMARRPTAMTSIPRPAASCTRNSPTPPLPPKISSWAPGLSASRAKASQAVPAATGVAAGGGCRVPGGAVGEVHHGHHPIAGAQPGNARPETLDHAGYVVTQNARHLEARPAAIGPVERVHRVDACRMNRNPDLARTGHGICDIGEAQLLRAAELANDPSLPPVPFPPRARQPATIAQVRCGLRRALVRLVMPAALPQPPGPGRSGGIDPAHTPRAAHPQAATYELPVISSVAMAGENSPGWVPPPAPPCPSDSPGALIQRLMSPRSSRTCGTEPSCRPGRFPHHLPPPPP